MIEDRIRLPSPNLIYRRSRLLKILEGLVKAQQRLIAVYAPTGFGKTVLLADFAQTTNLPVCWCSLTPGDQDPTAFLTLLAYSLSNRFHEIEAGELLEVMVQDDSQASADYIANLMKSLGPHLVMIDNYQQAASAGLKLAINRLLKQAPETMSIILASQYASTCVENQAGQQLPGEREPTLSTEALRFTLEETQKVMYKRFGRRLSLDEAQEIAQVTAGNIAQILLTGHIMHPQRMIGGLKKQLGNDHEVIYHYLAEEVFSKQPPKLRRFMMHTSVLPYMTTEMCNDLLNITNAQEYIEAAAHNDLFVVRVEEGFKYREFFAEFLRAALAQDQSLYRQLSLKAAQILAARSSFAESLHRYLPIQAWDEATALLEQQGGFFYDTGQALTLHNWLTKIPEQKLAQHPRLLLLEGRILNEDLGQPSLALTFFEKAESRFQEQNNAIGVAEAQVWKSAGVRMMGRVADSVSLASTGLSRLEALNADEQVIAWAVKNYGLAQWASGDAGKALATLRRALRKFEIVGDTYRMGLCHQDIGTCLRKQGNVRRAEYHYKKAVRIWESLGNANDLANTLSNLGTSLRLIGCYEEALQKFKDSLEIAVQIGAGRRAAFAQAGIGDTYLESEAYEAAIDAYSLSTTFAQEAEVRSLELYNMVKLGECFYHQQDLSQALALANQAAEIATELGLTFEKGLACVLQGRIYTRQAQYPAGFKRFAEALSAFAGNDRLEEAKVRLWWGYSLLLDLRVSAAFEQLSEAANLALKMGELSQGMRQAVGETRQLLFHFLHGINTPTGMRDTISLLLEQVQDKVDISKPGLQVFTFGAPMVIVAGERKQFSQRGRMSKLPELIAYLSIKGRTGGCRWSEISEALWPELDPDKASAVFHHSLKRLRDSILGTSDYVLVRDDYYQINPYYYEWCDAAAFGELYERSVKLPPEEALPLQLELIDLYQGEFLAGFDLEEWGTTYRTRCETRFLQVIKLAGKQLLKNGTPWRAVHILNKGLAQDYFQEDLHQSVLKAYAQLGLYGEVETHYRKLNQTFERELGLPPDPSTEKLYKYLLAKRG